MMVEDLNTDSVTKIQLVGQLRSEVDKLAQSFKNIEISSGSLSKNLSNAMGAMGVTPASTGNGTEQINSVSMPVARGLGATGATASAASSIVSSSGTMMTAWLQKQMNGSTNSIADVFATFLEGAGPITSIAGNAAMAGVAGALLGAPSLNDALQLQNILQRQRLYGATNPASSIQSFANQGLPTSAMDPAIAENMAVSYGITPALGSSFSTFMSGAANLSALAPGIGMQGGVMAMNQLNQPGNVNRLRMIGITARNIGTNTISSLDNVVQDLWNILSTAAGGAPTKNDLANSLLPGNALDSLLNQYFGDPVLKSAIVSALYQKAQGGDIRFDANGNTMEANRDFPTRPLAAGVLSESTVARQMLTAQLQLNDPIISGIVGANRVGGTAMENLTGFLSANGMFGAGGDLLSLVSFIDAFAGLGGGAGSYVLSGLGGVGSALGQGAGTALGGILKKFPHVGTMLPGLGAVLGGLGGMTAFGGPSAATWPPAQGSVTQPVINVVMSGTYTDGYQAGVAIANNIKRTILSNTAAWT